MVYQFFRVPDRSFDGLAGAVLGLVAPLALGAVLAGSWWWSPSNRLRVAAVIGTAALVLFGLELYLTLQTTELRPQPEAEESTPSIVQISARARTPFDTRTRAEVIKDLRARGTHVVLNFRPGAKYALREGPDGTLRSVISIDGVETLPMSGIPDALTVWCNELGTYEIYRSDQYGFRNPPSVWQRERIEIAVLGNSFAMGACVPMEKGFVDHIRRVHPGTLNLGMGHHGPLFELATLKEYLSTRRPRIVLWAYEEDNDLPHLERERRIPLLRRYLEGAWTQRLPSRQAELAKAVTEQGERELRRQLRALEDAGVDAGLDFVENTVKLRHVRGRLDLHLWKGREADTVDAAHLGLLREILQEAKRTTTAWGGRLIFVYLPARTRYAGSPSPSGRARDLVLNVVARLRIPIIDIHPAFQQHPDPLSLFPFRRFQHYTDLGHELVARQILSCMARHGFLRGSTRCPPPTSMATR